jgi:hypothetical protein
MNVEATRNDGGTAYNPTSLPKATPLSGLGAPAIFHVTHWKAGSQWLYKILIGCAPDLIVAPQLEMAQFLRAPLQEGKIYPTLYVTREEFDRPCLPSTWRRFVVIRDLRDTLVSSYYSHKVSHPILTARTAEMRAVLESLSLEEGLLYLMREMLPLCSAIQESWLASREPLIRYEDLLEHDTEILERVLLDQCGLRVARERFRDVVRANRFEKLTGGRVRGQEDQSSHERKGVAGDWHNCFSDRVKEAFKAQFGDLLVRTGYANDLRW